MSRRRGRPSMEPEPATAIVSLRVTPAQRLELRRVAADNRTHVGGLLREAVNEYVSDYRDRRVFRTTKR